MRRVLGQLTRWVEQKQVVPITIAAICPGGTVRIQLPDNPDRTLLDVPDRIIVAYVPDSAKSANANATPDSILGSGSFSATVNVPAEGGTLTAKVPGIKPGGHDVQLIYEWDDGPAEAPRLGLMAQGEHTF